MQVRHLVGRAAGELVQERRPEKRVHRERAVVTGPRPYDEAAGVGVSQQVESVLASGQRAGEPGVAAVGDSQPVQNGDQLRRFRFEYLVSDVTADEGVIAPRGLRVLDRSAA